MSLLRKRMIDIGGLLFDEELMEALGATAPRGRRERGAFLYVVLWGAAEDWGGYVPNYKSLAKKGGFLNFSAKEVEKFIEIFINEKKIIPYNTNDGRTLHWLVNLRKHQRLNNPPLPTLPLPPWITYETKETPKNKRTYVVYHINEDRLPADYRKSTCSLQAGYESSTGRLPVDYRKERNRREEERNNSFPSESAGASGSPPFDEEAERREFESFKQHIKKQCLVLMEHFGISRPFDPKIHKGSRFHPFGFVAYARSSGIPVKVIVKVLDSMVRQKDEIRNPYGWLMAVLRDEFSEYSYQEELKEHEKRKRWGLGSIGSVIKEVVS